MIRKFRLAATILFVGLFAAGALAAATLLPKKEFSVPSVVVDATLDPDGTLHVVEHITYDFTGRFSFGTRPIPVGTYTISDMTVTERGAAVASSGAPYNLTWYFDAQDETRTFDIAYTVRGAATVRERTSPSSTGSGSVRIIRPSAASR